MGIKIVRPPGRKDWYLRIVHRGERVTRHVGSREAAYAAKREIEVALAVGTFVRKNGRGDRGVAFSEAVGRWRKEHVEARLKPSSQRYYGSIVERWLLPAFGDMEVAAITRADVKAAVAGWRAAREQAPTGQEAGKEPTPVDGTRPRTGRRAAGLRSVPNVLRTLRSFFSWAVEEGIASSNPVENPSRIFRVDEPFRGDFLRPGEVPLYLEGLKAKAPRYFAILRTMTFTGLRLGEALGLEWGDVDWSGGFLTVRRSRWRDTTTAPKTARSIRRVTLSAETIETLRENRRAEAAAALKAGRPMPEQVFVNGAGAPMDESKVRRAHTLALKAAGLRRIRVHDLRGTFAALLVSAGVPVYHVSRMLGHSDPATTARHYADLAPGATREMPAILERYVAENSAGRDANQVQTQAPPEGGAGGGEPARA
jgi:integrase